MSHTFFTVVVLALLFALGYASCWAMHRVPGPRVPVSVSSYASDAGVICSIGDLPQAISERRIR